MSYILAHNEGMNCVQNMELYYTDGIEQELQFQVTYEMIESEMNVATWDQCFTADSEWVG